MKTSTLPTLTLTPYRTGVTQLGLVTRTALLDLALGYRDTQLGYYALILGLDTGL